MKIVQYISSFGIKSFFSFNFIFVWVMTYFRQSGSGVGVFPLLLLGRGDMNELLGGMGGMGLLFSIE
jgi:hypothetical protein